VMVDGIQGVVRPRTGIRISSRHSVESKAADQHALTRFPARKPLSDNNMTGAPPGGNTPGAAPEPLGGPDGL
jgi:hypothetical protein